MASDKNKLIIIGAGQAAAVCAKSLRSYGFGGEITMIGAEPERPYERPELSKGYLCDKVSAENLEVLSGKELEELDISFRPNTSATRLDIAQKQVILSNTETLDYDHLVIATGGEARRLPNCLTIRTLADADLLRTKLPNARSVGIIGAGWLGLELAQHMRSLDKSVTVYEMADRLCARVLPEPVSTYLQQAHEDTGVAFKLGQAPDLEALASQHDLMIACIGMEANDALAHGAGLKTDGGVLVDANQLSSHADVYAIGDCARHESTPPIESWAYANRSANLAAAAIADKEAANLEPLWFWSKQGPLSLQMIGTWDDGASIDVEETRTGICWYFREGDAPRGIIALNSPREFFKHRKKVQHALLM